MKPWKILVLSFCAIAALGVAALIHWMRPYDLNTERKAAHAAGFPLTVAELNIPILAPNENAATDYLELQALRKRRPVNAIAFDTWKGGPSLALVDARTAAEMKKVVTGRPDVTRLVHAAAARPHCAFPFNWSPYGVAPHFSQLASMREAAKWIRWESTVMARNGRYAEAVRNQALGLRNARHAGEEPLLMSCLLSFACQAIAMQGFEDILAMAGPNASVANAVRRELAAYGPAADITRCLKGEMVYGLKTINEVTSAGGGTEAPPTDGSLDTQSRTQGNRVTRWFYTGPSQAVSIHWMTRIIEASRAPAPKRAVAMMAVQQDMKRAMGNRPTAALTTILIPVFVKAGGRSVHAEARRTLVSAMASVLAYRARTGRYPDALGDAVTPVPIDPFTGNPLEYRHDGKGFVLSAEPDVTGEDARSAAKSRRTNTIYYPSEAPAAEATATNSPKSPSGD